MSGDQLTVQRMRLHAPRDMPVHALRARVEDALRISSKPAALVHRFVLLRRLRLVLPRHVSAQRLALQLEHEWRAIEALAQPMALASADAPAVWAVDEAQARGLLLQRWLHEQDVDAWFWQRLLPSAATTAPLAQRLGELLFAPFDGASATPVADVALRQALWRQAWPKIQTGGLGAQLWRVLSPLQRERLEAAGLRPEAPQAAALLETVGANAAVADASVRNVAGQGLRHDPVVPEVARHPASWTPRAAASAARVATHGTAPLPVTPLPGPTPVGSAAAGAAAPARAGRSAPPSPVLLPCDGTGAPFDALRDTAWAGLWFLLPLLMRQGIASQAQPAALLAAILRHAAARHGLDAAALDGVEQVAAHAGLDASTPQDLQIEATHWWRRARWFSLQQARLPLCRVLLRSGRIWLSPHRIDVYLPLQRAHVRIRRAGFDIDPGHVPWLDCVFHFHYVT